MNTSHFMDKQITARSAAPSDDLLNLLNQPEFDRNRQINGSDGSGKMEEILPSYDFQPIRGAVASSAPPPPSFHLEGSGSAWGPVDSKLTSSNLRNYGSLEMHESSRTFHEKSKETYDTDVVAEIDRTVKKHVDILLNALESVSSRLSQLDARTHHLESSVDDLKFAVGNNTGSTDGKLRQLENIMREVQTGVQVLRDNYEIMEEAQLKLSKLQTSNGNQQISSATQGESQQQPPPPQPLLQPPPPPVASPQQPTLPASPAHQAPNVPPQQNPPVPYPTQFAPNQIPPVPSREQPYPPPGQPQEPPHPYPPAIQQSPPGIPPLLPSQPYQIPPQLPSYPPPPQPSYHQPGFAPRPEETSTYPHSSQTHPPSVRPPTGGPPLAQFYGPGPNAYEPPAGKPSSVQVPLSAGYNPPSGSGFNELYPSYGGPASHYPNPQLKPPQFSSSGPPSGGSNQPCLPTAQLLPQAVPTGSSSSGPAGNRVPIDDVVEKVATMGFSRDQVRATVRKLTENGQSVDLNVVLDKLMNGSDIQPQGSWYGR